VDIGDALAHPAAAFQDDGLIAMLRQEASSYQARGSRAHDDGPVPQRPISRGRHLEWRFGKRFNLDAWRLRSRRFRFTVRESYLDGIDEADIVLVAQIETLPQYAPVRDIFWAAVEDSTDLGGQLSFRLVGGQTKVGNA
jgi:hypothetical protein